MPERTSARHRPPPLPVVERYRVLLDGLSDAAVIVDAELRPLAWNAAYVEAVGVRGRRFARLAAAGARCHDLFELEVCSTDCLARRCFETLRFVRMDEIGGTAKKGGDAGDQSTTLRRHSTLIVSAVPLLDERGAASAVLEVYRDVTAEARIQERYKYLLERERHRAGDLEVQVRARTAELERSLEELRATRAQLVRSEKLSSLGQLVAGIAHEINNPINFIYGNVEFLRAYVVKLLEFISELDAVVTAPTERAVVEDRKRAMDLAYVIADTLKLLASVKNGAERIAAIIRDLRTFIHGGASGERELLAVASCLETTVNLVVHQTRGRIEIVRREEPDLPLVFGDLGQLNQVFMNLVVNAIQAIPRKGVITIDARRQDGGVAVDVTDDGVGISEADQLKVFDPFFTTKPVGQGTGLGLSISYSVVDAHGGKLTVRSQAGKGSTFTVWLPAGAPAVAGPR